MTQTELAIASGLSQAYLSKAEGGAVELTGERLDAVAGALGYPATFFLDDASDPPAPTACAFPRKRNSLPTSAEKRIRAMLEITRRQAEPLLDTEVAAVDLERRAADDGGWTSGVDMAVQVRARVGLPDDPIGNMVWFLEALGVLVIIRDLGNRRIDAIGQWPDGHRPLMLANSHAPVDRQRFTLAHELGHAVLHSAPQADQETEADEFASELLLPAARARALFDGSLSLARLAELKAVWGMSMAALLRRAYDLGRITDYRYKQLNVELSAAGYRTKEPVALPPETPTLLLAAIERRTARGESIADLARQARMTEDELALLYLEAA